MLFRSQDVTFEVNRLKFDKIIERRPNSRLYYLSQKTVPADL
jgi:hypothetical protein